MRGRSAELARGRVASSVLCALLTSTLLVGCGSTCSDLEDRFATRLRREVARVGPGLRPIGGGEVHLGLSLSETFLQRLTRLVTVELQPFETRVSAGTGRERRAALEIATQPMLQRIDLAAGDGSRVVLHYVLETQVTVRRPGTRSEHRLVGQARSVGELELSRDEAGEPVLYLLPMARELSNDDRFRIEQPVEPLSGSVAESVRTFVERRTLRMLELQEPVPLLRFPSLLLGPLRVGLSPADVRIDPSPSELGEAALGEAADVPSAEPEPADEASSGGSRPSLFVGFVTSLRPLSRGGVQPTSLPPDGDVVYFVHPGLPAAVVRLALAEGGIERRYGEAFGDGGGTVSLTLERLGLGQGDFVLEFHAWSLEDSCGVVEVIATGRVEILKGEVLLAVDGVEVGGSGPVEAEPWAESPFLASTLDLVRRLIDRQSLVLGDGTLLSTQPRDVRIDRRRVEVTLEP